MTAVDREDEPGDLGRSIQDALEAARAAEAESWFAPDEDRPHVSYSFHLDGLPDAPDVDKIEAAVESIDGVRCRIVRPREAAWITATVDTPPDAIAARRRGLGVTATLSDTSLLRHATSLHSAEHHARRKSEKSGKFTTGKVRRRQRLAERSLDRARKAGYGVPVNKPKQLSDDVLYTARDLVTPARMWLALVLTLPVLVMAYVPATQFDGWQWLSLALATPVVTWCALPFHRALLGGVRRGSTALDGASSVAILIAYVWSAAVICFAPTGHRGWHSGFTWFATTYGTQAGPELFLDVACGITLLLLIGRRYSIRARRLLIDEMSHTALHPDTEYTLVEKVRGCADVETQRIPVSEINLGDDILVHVGETIPVDGKVIGGRASLRPGLIDAYAQSRVKVGSVVHAGSVVGKGEIKVRATRTGHTTRWAAVHHWLSEAEKRQRYASVQSARSAAVLLPLAMLIALMSFLLWGLIAQDYNAALRTALAVLSGVAPVALALSPSLAMRLGVEAAARNGVLVRDGETLRKLELVDTVVFNRVGTVAESTMHVESVTAAEGESEEMILRLAGALAMDSEHATSQALVQGAREARSHASRSPELPARYELVSANVERSGDITGRIALTYVDEEGHETTNQVDAMLWRPSNLSDLHGRLAVAATAGGTPVVVRWKGKDRGVITLFDPFKPDADEAVSILKAQGLETVMMTRDTYPVARRFADYLGITKVLAGITSDKKPGAIRMLQAAGAEVAMVGDNSVRDALLAADVSMLYARVEDLGAKRQNSRHLSIVLMRDDVMAVPLMVSHARKVCSIIDQNVYLSWSYNIAVVVLAIAGMIPPIIATLLMLGSSLLIEGRSMRARKFPQASRLR